MVEQLLKTLIAADNEAADDVLLEALRLGSPSEQARCLEALLTRKTPTGIFGLLRQFPELASSHRLAILERAGGELYHLLPEAGRADDPAVRCGALRVIAMARLGRLAYVISENLHHPDAAVAATAVDALVALARFVATEVRRLQSPTLAATERSRACRRLLEMRPDIESAVYRAIDLRRLARDAAAPAEPPVNQPAEGVPGEGPIAGVIDGRRQHKLADLLRAALLLADHPASRTLAVLSTSHDGGVSPLVRQLLQPPDAEHVDALLLGVTHGQLRSTFPAAIASLDSPPALDGLLRRTHYLKDHRLELAVRQVSRGVWWTQASLLKDLARRPADDFAARTGEWIAASAAHDIVQDDKLIHVLGHVRHDPTARLRLLRIALRRPRGGSLALLRRFLDDPDETLQRIATREIVRRKPADYSSVLLGLMKSGPESVRRVAARAISANAFDNFFERFDRLDPPTRERAGRAVFKLLPDALQRLTRKLTAGPPDDRVRALAVVETLQLADRLRDAVLGLLTHDHPKVRSKAVTVAGLLSEPVPDAMLDRALADPDPRVRANAIEVLEKLRREDYVQLLAVRARATAGRERANAIKALYTLRGQAALPQLTLMLRDPRPQHRISALWAARHVGLFSTLNEILQLAQTESDPRVRRYAQAALRYIAERVRAAQSGQLAPATAPAAVPGHGSPLASSRPVVPHRFPQLPASPRLVR